MQNLLKDILNMLSLSFRLLFFFLNPLVIAEVCLYLNMNQMTTYST